MKMLDRSYIEKELTGSLYNVKILDTVTSTNTIMKEAAQKGEKEFSVIIAREQTAGRGRMGHTFYSPDESGLYMSILIRPESKYNSLTLTTDAAVSCARALEKISGEKTCIKWVNDIYMRGRKVCGILAEAAFGESSYIVLGIGVNTAPPEGGFPEDIKMRAGSVFKRNGELLREKTAVAILKEFMNIYTLDDKKRILDEYREKSMIIGKEIDVIKNGSEEKAVALSIDEDYSLVVKKKDGSLEKLNSGDVSIRV